MRPSSARSKQSTIKNDDSDDSDDSDDFVVSSSKRY